MLFLKHYQGALKTREEAIRLKEQEFEQDLRHRRIMRQEFNLFIGSALFIASVFFIGIGMGAIAGLNAPDGAVCAQANLPCQWFRLRNPKTVI